MMFRVANRWSLNIQATRGKQVFYTHMSLFVACLRVFLTRLVGFPPGGTQNSLLHNSDYFGNRAFFLLLGKNIGYLGMKFLGVYSKGASVMQW